MPWSSSIRQNQRLIFQITFGSVFVALGIYFLRHEIGELSQVRNTLSHADPKWLFYGFILLSAFVVVQGMMYQQSFRTIHEKIHLSTGISLFLKRNLISVFLPAGTVTNMLFFNESVERKDGVSRTQIYFASSVFSICSILSGVIIGIPAIIWLLLKQRISGQMILGISLVTVLLAGLLALVVSYQREGWVYQQLERRAPDFVQVLNEMRQQTFNRKRFWLVLGLSLVIEVIGISHLFIAVKALGSNPSLGMAVIGYAIVLLLLMSSPFLRGIGAVEAALTYTLTLFGLTPVLALSVAFLFRFYEFWTVLVLGLLAIVAKRDNLIIRTFPALLLFFLGLVNIISGITPALPDRLESLTRWIPLGAIAASNWMVILSGIIMLVTSIYLVQGLRNAWITALVLSGLSLIAHLTKGMDWEEASVAMFTIGSLLYQRHQYFIKPDLKLAKRTFLPGLGALFGVILFGTIAFWLLNRIHFNTDFTLWESLKKSVGTFFLLNTGPQPLTVFGRQLITGLNILGGTTMVFCTYLLFRPLIFKPDSTDEEDLELARYLIRKYGRSSLDHFKIYPDKKFWFNPDRVGFVSFKNTNTYAIVLENPVCQGDEALAGNILAFDRYCQQNGLRSAYYRIPEKSKHIYEDLGKNIIPIGEEAIVDLFSWSTEGKKKAGLRNEINKLTRLGYGFKVNVPPQRDAFLQQLKAVSDAWLNNRHRTELVFSQGLFRESELKNQIILSLENPEGRVLGFINLVPDYIPQEANFDLMRDTEDAPHGTMDFLFVKMIEYLRETGFRTCNLGMVPMAGLDEPGNLHERILRLAYERIHQFSHYKSLRAYKDKFEPEWQMMYLAYDAPLDLLFLPGALERVFKP